MDQVLIVCRVLGVALDNFQQLFPLDRGIGHGLDKKKLVSSLCWLTSPLARRHSGLPVKDAMGKQLGARLSFRNLRIER